MIYAFKKVGRDVFKGGKDTAGEKGIDPDAGGKKEGREKRCRTEEEGMRELDMRT